ncbi:MAG: LPS-assembly protein LptD [Spirochaetaceae bacterium]|nr:LPS-assembly protein LptD [Spirochaetaceae bacterium]
MNIHVRFFPATAQRESPLVILLFLSAFLRFSLLAPALYAQEADTPDLSEQAQTAADDAAAALGEDVEAAEEAAAIDEEAALTEEELAAQQEAAEAARIMELEIKTSTLFELAEWCRGQGLSEGGSRDELANRLRDHFGLPRPDGSAAPDQKVVTIEAARTTEYFTLNAVDEEYARLSGGVKLNLSDGDARHSIKAWDIVFNRTRNIISATGDVEYIKEEGDKRETFKGESITINLDTWIGSFIDTISERSIAGSETAYRFAGQVISQTDKETTVLTKAHVTNAKTDEPYWSLDASKLWILPGSDWALFNGVLRVGEIPVLWMPFFFFPAGEMVIHPALGTRTREGTFFQTTTYIFGRPDSSTIKQNSITQILGSGEGMEQVREGLFLRTTGRKDTNTDKRKISILADIYTNLGFYVGTEVSLPKLAFINNFSLSAGLAFTRTIFKSAGGAYVPYNIQQGGDWKEHWDKSYIFGVEVPFRYRFTTSPSVSGKYGSVSLSLPMYSDPFINHDVMDRSESIDWMEMLRQGAATPDTPDTSSTNQGSFEWNLSVKPQLSITSLAPYISSLSINSISSVYHFSYKNDTGIANAFPTSPQRIFYYPDKFTLYSISGGIGGTPLTWTSAVTIAEKDKEVEDPLKKFGKLRSPWGEEMEKTGESNTPSIQKPFLLTVPALNHNFDIGRNSGLKITWDYNLTPTSAAELNYSAEDWETSNDINLSDIQSILMRVRTDGSTGIGISDPNNNMFSITGGLSGSMQWQDHTYINEEAEEYDTDDKIKNEKFADYRSTVWTTSWTHNTTMNPLFWSPMLKTSNIQYSLGGLLARSNFDEAASSVNSPSWEIIHGEWNKDNISKHDIAVNFGVSILDKMQSLHLDTELPPRDSNLNMNSTVNAWISTTTVKTMIKNPFEAEPQYQPASFSETLTFKPGYTFSQYLVYDPAYSDWTNLSSTLTLSKFSATYSSSRTPGFTLDPATGWKERPSADARLRPVSIGAGFSTAFKKENLLNKRLGFSLDPGIKLNLDLQRYTYSNLEFSLNFTLNVTKFLSLSMGTHSQNQEMYRYLSFLPFFSEHSSEIPKDTSKTDNFFLDLINSFRFDNEELRKSSGFKLKSFNFSATHHLGDWDARLTIGMTPYREGTEYKFDTRIAFLLQWLPISELKTELSYESKTDTFTTK